MAIFKLNIMLHNAPQTLQFGNIVRLPYVSSTHPCVSFIGAITNGKTVSKRTIFGLQLRTVDKPHL